MQEADNVIPTQDWSRGLSLSTIWLGVIKTDRSIRIYRPSIFIVRYGTNQSYYQEYDWESLSPYPAGKAKGRTPQSKQLKEIMNKKSKSI